MSVKSAKHVLMFFFSFVQVDILEKTVESECEERFQLVSDLSEVQIQLRRLGVQPAQTKTSCPITQSSLLHCCGDGRLKQPSEEASHSSSAQQTPVFRSKEGTTSQSRSASNCYGNSNQQPRHHTQLGRRSSRGGKR